MSSFTKNEILEKEPINSFRTNKQIIKENIKSINSPNIQNNKNKGKNTNEKVSYYKKVCIKPFRQRKKDYITNINKDTNNNKTNWKHCIKLNKIKLETKMNYSNNDIINKSENKNTIDNKKKFDFNYINH